ncbi:MAG: type IV secretory system conjugative DNA transfer family protein [Bacteroidetes bacterium]|nr:MAG: type IV secretory system conjugative DNA transfer family protein [Bacteroidota bacterium]
MDKTTLIEYALGGSNMYVRFLLYLMGWTVYSIFMKRKWNIPLFIGVPLSFLMATVFPLTLGLPLYLILWVAYRLLIHMLNSFGKSETKLIIEKVDDESFCFQLDNRNILLENPYRGIYIQGGAGSGKSASLVYPILKQAIQKGYSGICYDFKSPELARFLFQNAVQNQSTVRPYFIDFRNAKRSIRVNPLEPRLMTKTAYANEYAQTLMYNLSPNNIKNEDYWIMEAKSVLTGLIWYLKIERPAYCTLPHLISLVLHSDVGDLITKVSGNYQAAGYVASLKQAIENESTRQVSGVLSTLQTNLAKLNTPDIFWILSGNDIDLNVNDPSNPKFVCIGNESTLAETYAPVVSLILSVALKRMNQPDKHKSIVMVDELPTLYINKLEQTPATARSNKVATILACQDFSQLVDRYGRDKAQVIISNMGNQFFGRTVNKDSAQMICHLFGKSDKTFKTTNHGDNYYQSTIFGKHTNSLNKSINETVQERDRVKVTDIMNLQPGEFYGFIAEGNEHEILKSKFQIDQEFGEETFDFPEKATEMDIQDNYHRIIDEAKSILDPNTEQESKLIRF